MSDRVRPVILRFGGRQIEKGGDCLCGEVPVDTHTSSWEALDHTVKTI